MKIVAPSLVIEENDAFENDLFNRSHFGEALLNIVDRSNGELVLSLDGKWGEGKTTFVKMWQGLLNEADIPNIYVDAFANDYIEDAFISVASVISDYADKNIENGAVASEFKSIAKNVGGKLLSLSLKVGIKAATLGLIRDSEIEELKDIGGDISQGASNIAESFIEDRLNSHSEDIELLQSFRDLLSRLPTELGGEEIKPLVIIIDELDRCKPTYAVDVIEKIKHLFSVENIVFVLVMHKTQLEEAVKCIYGENIDAHSYLQKFIHIETSLPKNIRGGRVSDLRTYSQRLLELHELNAWGDENIILDCVELLAVHLNLTLRQLEKVFTNIAILYSTSTEEQLRLVPIIVFLSLIKVANPNLYHRIVKGDISYTKIFEEINLIDSEPNENPRRLQWMLKWIKYSLLPEEIYDQLENDSIENQARFEFEGFGESLWEHGIEREQIISIFIQRLSMFVVDRHA